MDYQPSTPGGEGERCSGDKETLCPPRVKWHRFQTFSVRDIGVFHKLEVRCQSQGVTYTITPEVLNDGLSELLRSGLYKFRVYAVKMASSHHLRGF